MTFRTTNFRKSILLLINACMIAALVACGGNNSPNPSPVVTVTQPISVSLSSTPASLYINDTLSVTATVTNDTANGGVTWSCAPEGTCGTFSASNSASGVPVTYTAPATVPSTTVVITATSVTDTTKNAATPAITIKPASGITVSLTTAPPSSLSPGGTANIAATVTGDSANGGVTWSCSPVSSCGGFNPNATASAAPTVYTAGTTTGNVVLTATSVSDDAQSASANLTITGAAGATSLAAGNYVFSLAGEDFNDSPYFVAGAFTVTVSGGTTTITGEQDFSDYNSEVHDNISSGTIAQSVDSSTGDSNLIITLQTGDPCIGPGATGSAPNCTGGTGAEVLDATLVSSSKGQLIEFDAWASGSGTLDLQSTTLSTPTGGYAFALNGLDINANPIVAGGVINVDNAGGTGNIDGTGSVFDMNDDGTLYPSQSFTASAVSTPPDGFGLVTFNLNSNSALLTNTDSYPGITLVGYMVDNAHIRLVENWNVDWLSGTTGGTALGQTGAGTFSSSSISGSSYVFGAAGYDSVGPLQTAGVLTFNQDGSLTGNLSFNDFATQSPQGGSPLAAEVTATPCSGGSATTPCYSVDTSGTGRLTITNLTDNATFLYNLQLYLDGNGNALLISMDTNVVPNGPDEQAGLAYHQTGGSFTAGSFAGSYALNIDQQDTAGGFEYDGVGLISADGVGSFKGYLDTTGILASPLSQVPDDLTPGSFTAAASGVFTGTIYGITTESADISAGDTFTFYLVDPTQGVAIQTGPTNDQITLGIFELQQ